MKKFYLAFSFMVVFTPLLAFEPGDTLIYTLEGLSFVDSYTRMGNVKMMLNIEGKISLKYKFNKPDSILLVATVKDIKVTSGIPGMGFSNRIPMDSLIGEEFAITIRDGGIYYNPYNPAVRVLFDPVVFPFYLLLKGKNFKKFTMKKYNDISGIYMKGKLTEREGEKDRFILSGRYEEDVSKRIKEVKSKIRMKYNMDFYRDMGRNIPLSGWFDTRNLEITLSPIGAVNVDSEIYMKFELED